MVSEEALSWARWKARESRVMRGAGTGGTVGMAQENALRNSATGEDKCLEVRWAPQHVRYDPTAWKCFLQRLLAQLIRPCARPCRILGADTIASGRFCGVIDHITLCAGYDRCEIRVAWLG